MAKRYRKETKEEVLKKIREGQRVSEVAKAYGISDMTIQTWLEQDTDSEPKEDIWQAFERVLSQFSDDALSDLPKDLSINHDHYLYGTPKKS